MKFKKFDEKNHLQPITQMFQGKFEHSTANVYFDPSNGMQVTCLEVTKEDIKRMTQSGEIWIMFGPGMPNPNLPPFSLQTKHPFRPDPDKKTGYIGTPLTKKSNLVSLNGKPLTPESNEKEEDKKDQDKKSPSDDGKPDSVDTRIP